MGKGESAALVRRVLEGPVEGKIKSVLAQVRLDGGGSPQEIGSGFAHGIFQGMHIRDAGSEAI